MSSKRQILRTTIFCIIAMGSVAFLKAAYYEPDLFPIGLTGIGYTGDWTCPYYSKGPEWRWTRAEKGDTSEQALIEELGVNCIGCEDAWYNYLIDFAEVRTGNTYLEEVLTELTDSADNPTVYLITASYGAAPKRLDKNIIFKYTEANL